MTRQKYINPCASAQVQTKTKIKPYGKIETWFFQFADEHNLSVQELSLSLILLKFVQYGTNIATCSLDELAQSSRVSKKTVISALKHLEQLNLLKKTSNTGYTNAYRLAYCYVGLKEEIGGFENLQKEKESTRGCSSTAPGGCSSTAPPLYIYNTKKTQTNKKRDYVPTKKDDDRFNKNLDKKKLHLAKAYTKLLVEQNRVKIRTTESQYLLSVYKNNEETNSWEDLKKKYEQLKADIEIKNSLKMQYFVGTKVDAARSKTTQKIENVALKKLRQNPEYTKKFNRIFNELKRENPLIKSNGAFTEKLVHAELLKEVA